MSAFDRGSRRDSGKSFGRRSDGDRFGKPRSSRTVARRGESFDATCDKCGKKCDLPFKPTGRKPVYCRDCFKDADSTSSRSGDFDRKPNFDREVKSSSSSSDLDQINRKLDKIMQALRIE